MGSKSSWRLSFVDVDSSFVMTTEDSDIYGYIVCRAPKGTTEAAFFPPNNQKAIEAYIGLGGSSYPDIEEAVAFNSGYGLYISAPAGSSSSYPSYFGGYYITSTGLQPFYNISNKDSIDYTTSLQLGSTKVEAAYDQEPDVDFFVKSYDSNSTAAEGTNKESNIAIMISNINSTCWADLKVVGVDYWGDTYHDAGVYYFDVDKSAHVLNVEDSDEVAQTTFRSGVWYKYTNADSAIRYSLVISGNDTGWVYNRIKTLNTANANVAYNAFLNSNLLKDAFSSDGTIITCNTDSAGKSSVGPLFTVNDSLIENCEEALTTKCSAVATSSTYSEADFAIKWTDIQAYYEGTFTAGTLTYPWEGNEYYSTTDKVVYTVGTPIDLTDNLTFALDIQDKTYGYIFQKSPTEKVTSVSISQIGYDKWTYDYALPLINFGSLDPETVVAGLSNPPELMVGMNTKGKMSIYSYVESENDDDTTSMVFSDVTSDYVSQEILIWKYYTVAASDSSDSDSSSGDDTYALTSETSTTYTHKIYYIESEDDFEVEAEDDVNYPLNADVNYNTMTFSVTEEVYPDEDTAGGEFTGSFDEGGTDTYGSNIYWPNVLSSEDFSFVGIEPVRTFDKEVDDDGIYTGVRIVDDTLTEDFLGNSISDSYDFTMQGQRYMTHIVDKNISNSVVGGTWTASQYAICKKGWVEAKNDVYDDVSIFMEPTGYEKLKTLQSAVVGVHVLAIGISPKIITQAQFDNPTSITVTARNKQMAQYVGEFKVYDEYTGKYYYCQPIGDVGYMCAKIMDEKMGGWPPAWYNYNNMGGQLSRSVLSAKWNFSDATEKILDSKGLNPIAYNSDDGLMIKSGKTTQDPNSLSDWSFLAHTMSFIICKREIRDNVMRPQIEKPIDDYWLDLRQQQTEAILLKRTSGTNKIWTSTQVKCNDSSVNNATTKAKRWFYIYVRVKVTPYSEGVTLTFENVAQSTILS